MIFKLIKRDPAWTFGLGFTAAVLILSLTGLGPVTMLGFEATMVIASRSIVRLDHRATLFEVALPIAGRQLFLSRVLSLLLMVWMPAFAGVARILARATVDWPTVWNTFDWAAIFTLAIALSLSAGLPQLACNLRLLFVVWASTAAAGALAWYSLPPAAVLALFALTSVAVFLKAWLAVPESFQVAPVEVVDAPMPSRAAAAAPSGTAAPARAWWPILRSALSWNRLLYFPLMALLGMTGNWFYFLSIFVIQGTAQSRQRTRWLYALPLSYRALLLLAIVPTLATLLGGVAVGTTLDGVFQRGAAARVNVPLEFWRRVPKGKVPAIQSPWGETAQPASISVMGFTFYNPYSVGIENSRRFREWQLERTAVAEKAALTARPRLRILTLSAALLVSLFLVFVAEWTRWHRLHRLSVRRRILLGAVAAAPLVAAFALESFYMIQDAVSIGAALAHAVLLRVSDFLPDNLLLMMAAVAVPLAMMYWALEKQFARSELTTRAPAGLH